MDGGETEPSKLIRIYAQQNDISKKSVRIVWRLLESEKIRDCEVSGFRKILQNRAFEIGKNALPYSLSRIKLKYIRILCTLIEGKETQTA